MRYARSFVCVRAADGGGAGNKIGVEAMWFVGVVVVLHCPSLADLDCGMTRCVFVFQYAL